MVVLGLAVVLLVDINPNILQARLGGDLPTITVSWLLIATLVVITSTGADMLVRSHPEMQTRPLPKVNLGFTSFEIAPGFWVLPSLSVVGSFAFFRLFSSKMQGAAFVLSLVAAGGLLLVVLVAQHYALDRNKETSQRAQLVLQIVTYLLAFGTFSAIYSARLRTLYSAVLVASAAHMLAYEVLHWTPRQQLRYLAATIGLVLAEVTWALNYWAAPFLMGGAVLLIVFYLTVSVLHHHALGTLKRHVMVEYGVIGGVLLLVAVLATF